MAKKAKKKSEKKLLKYKFTSPKAVGYYPENLDLKPKKKHWATKLKEERDELEGKLFHLYKIYEQSNGGGIKTPSDAFLIEWILKNRKVNHMTIQRKTYKRNLATTIITNL